MLGFLENKSSFEYCKSRLLKTFCRFASGLYNNMTGSTQELKLMYPKHVPIPSLQLPFIELSLPCLIKLLEVNIVVMFPLNRRRASLCLLILIRCQHYSNIIFSVKMSLYFRENFMFLPQSA